MPAAASTFCLLVLGVLLGGPAALGSPAKPSIDYGLGQFLSLHCRGLPLLPPGRSISAPAISCNFEGTRERSVLNFERESLQPYARASINNAEAINLGAGCGHSFYFRNVESLNILPKLESPPPSCQTELFAFNTKVSSIEENMNSIFLYSSEADHIYSLSPVRRFQTRGSNIKMVSKLLSAARAQNFLIDSTKIEFIKNMVIFQDLNFVDSHVGIFASEDLLAHANVHIMRSTVHKIATHGLQSLSGTVILNDTLIDSLDKHALVLAGGTDLILSDVVINNCEAPCIVLSTVANLLQVNNVTINGEDVSTNNFGRFALYRFSQDSTLGMTADQRRWQDNCKQDKNDLRCKFTQHDQTKSIGPFNSSVEAVTIENSTNVTILYRGSHHLTLHNTTGSVRSTGFGYSTCHGTTWQEVYSSVLSEMEIPCYSSLTAINSKLGSAFSQGSPGVVTKLAGSQVGYLRNMVVTKGSFNWVNSTIGVVDKVSVFTRHSLVNTFIVERIKEMVVHKALRLVDCIINSISNLTIEEGAELVIEMTEIRFAHPSSIYLKRNAKMAMINTTVAMTFVKGMISAESYDQITGYSFLSSGFWLPDLVTLRHLTAVTSLPLHASLHTNVLDKKFCIKSADTTICDYSRIPDADVVHMSGKFEEETSRMSRVIYRNAASLSLTDDGHYPDQVDVEDVGHVFIPKSSTLMTSLSIINSAASSLECQSQTLKLHGIITELLKSDYIGILNVRQSTLMNLDVAVHKGVIENTRVQKISKLKVIGSVEFRNCTIESISNLAVFVSFGSSLVFENCTIKHIHQEGIIVHGKIVINNGVINSLADESIILGERLSEEFVFKNLSLNGSVHSGFVDLSQKDRVLRSGPGDINEIAGKEFNVTFIQDSSAETENSSTSLVTVTFSNKAYANAGKATSYILKTIQDVIREFYNEAKMRSKLQPGNELFTKSEVLSETDGRFSLRNSLSSTPMDGEFPLFSYESINSDSEGKLIVGLAEHERQIMLLLGYLLQRTNKSVTNTEEDERITLLGSLARPLQNNFESLTLTSTPYFGKLLLSLPVIIGIACASFAVLCITILIVCCICCARTKRRKLEAESAIPAIDGYYTPGNFSYRGSSRYESRNTSCSTYFSEMQGPVMPADNTSIATTSTLLASTAEFSSYNHFTIGRNDSRCPTRHTVLQDLNAQMMGSEELNQNNLQVESSHETDVEALENGESSNYDMQVESEKGLQFSPKPDQVSTLKHQAVQTKLRMRPTVSGSRSPPRSTPVDGKLKQLKFQKDLRSTMPQPQLQPSKPSRNPSCLEGPTILKKDDQTTADADNRPGIPLVQRPERRQTPERKHRRNNNKNSQSRGNANRYGTCLNSLPPWEEEQLEVSYI